MAGTVLDGKTLAKHIEKTLSERVQRLQERSCVPTFVGEACQALTHGSIQAFNKSCI